MEEIMKPIVEAAIISAVPELGLPVIKQITDAVEHALEDKLTKYAETGATFIVIDIQVGDETTRMGKALANLERAIASGDPGAISAAQDEYDKAQAALVEDDGSATAQ